LALPAHIGRIADDTAREVIPGGRCVSLGVTQEGKEFDLQARFLAGLLECIRPESQFHFLKLSLGKCIGVAAELIGGRDDPDPTVGLHGDNA